MFSVAICHLSTVIIQLSPGVRTKPIEVLKPEKEWEGALLPNHKSVASAINTPVNQLRDPAVFTEENKNYLLYALRGENGIGIVEFSISD